MKSVNLAALGLAMALGSAQASVYTATEVIDAGEIYTFGNGVIEKNASSFADTYKFSFGSGVASAGFQFNIEKPNSPISTFNVSYLGNAIEVTGGNEYLNVNYQDEDGDWITIVGINKAEYRFLLTNLASGEKAIDVAGTFASPFAETRDYTLTISARAAASNVTAVPEPESLALILAGLGVMTAFARRKSTNQ